MRKSAKNERDPAARGQVGNPTDRAKRAWQGDEPIESSEVTTPVPPGGREETKKREQDASPLFHSEGEFRTNSEFRSDEVFIDSSPFRSPDTTCESSTPARSGHPEGVGHGCRDADVSAALTVVVCIAIGVLLAISACFSEGGSPRVGSSNPHRRSPGALPRASGDPGLEGKCAARSSRLLGGNGSTGGQGLSGAAGALAPIFYSCSGKGGQ